MSGMGWIKLHRKIQDSRVFANPDILKLWILCLIRANHDENWVDIDRLTDPVRVRPGQFVTGRYSLHRDFYPTRKKSNKTPLTVWRWLEKLEDWGKLNIETNNSYSLVTITNWEKYQYQDTDDQRNDQRVNNERTASDQRVNTNKNDNNDQNEKNDKKYTVGDAEKWNGEDSIDYSGFVDRFNEIYELEGRSRLRITEKKRKQIRGRLRTWTGEEIERAWKNRLKSPFLNGDGSKFMTDWEAAMRNDEKIQRYQKIEEEHNGKGIDTDSLQGRFERTFRND